jgi:hypothetical protein
MTSEIASLALGIYNNMPENLKVGTKIWTEEFAKRLITEVDTLRGRDAVAWKADNGNWTTSHKDALEYERRMCKPMRPLFFSPTIPEGMCMVPLDAWQDAYAAFQGAFDTAVERRRNNSEYAQDARRRLRNLNESIAAAKEQSHE